LPTQGAARAFSAEHLVRRQLGQAVVRSGYGGQDELAVSIARGRDAPLTRSIAGIIAQHCAVA
jgi:hypothetical protein